MGRIRKTTGRDRTSRFARLPPSFRIKRLFAPFAAESPPIMTLATGERPRVGARISANYEVEQAAYERVKPDLLRSLFGRFVVFHGEEMIGPFDDFKAAYIAGRRRFGLGPIYVKEVLPQERVYEA